MVTHERNLAQWAPRWRRARVGGLLCLLAGSAGAWGTPALRAQSVRVANAATVAPTAAEYTPTVAELITAGDREFVARRAVAALAHYEQALALVPDRYDVLWRTARTLVEVGEAEGSDPRRRATFARAGELAARAVLVNPRDAEGHFQQSRALGRVALDVSPRERTHYAVQIREAALRALAVDPQHAGAQHVLGRWHAEIMRLNGVTRSIARTFLGGKVFGEASWGEAVRLLEAANTTEPNRTVHLVALGQVYRDAGRKEAARLALEAAVRAPLTDPNDEQYKREAARDLKALR
jgi:tetratricopeptide (TPR) repeat protein